MTNQSSFNPNSDDAQSQLAGWRSDLARITQSLTHAESLLAGAQPGSAIANRATELVDYYRRRVDQLNFWIEMAERAQDPVNEPTDDVGLIDLDRGVSPSREGLVRVDPPVGLFNPSEVDRLLFGRWLFDNDRITDSVAG